MKGVRWREDTGFEGQCSYCREYLPLTTEFWYPKHGVARCTACWRSYKRLRQQGYKGDPRQLVWRENQRARLRLISTAEYERRLEMNRRWKAANRAHIAEYNKAYRARQKAAA